MKSFVVAKREYLAAVKTKSFIISLVMFPVLMSAGFIAQRLTENITDTSERKIVILDRSGAGLGEHVAEAARQRNDAEAFEGEGEARRQVGPTFAVELLEPAALTDAAAVNRQRLELSQRVRDDELLAFVEIGPDVIDPKLDFANAAERQQELRDANLIDQAEAAQAMLGENNLILYFTARPTYSAFRSFLNERLVPRIVQRKIMSQDVPPEVATKLSIPPQVATRGLYIERGGQIERESKGGTAIAFILPVALVFLMFMIVLVGTSPLTTNILEEKQLRIAEVLLGSATPFQLMLGKLTGGAGVAITLAAIYFSGAYVMAVQFDVARYLTPTVLVSFGVFTVIATFMYGSMFVAAGAAVSEIKEAQNYVGPIMIVIISPMFVIGPLLEDPNGPLATLGSFFPFSAPMVTTARMAVPPGIPLYQMVLSGLLAVATTLALVWVAGRIFRVGILTTGRGASLRDLGRWIIRG
ncbi:MAG: ABC transporter permease [Phycisphaerae bacterium]